jgi:predicted ABC-type transport system involved in lysophospholipase L1 biosynthesis ATPase subunit
MAEDAPTLIMRGVRKTFEAENAPVRALRGVDLVVSSGEFVALTGPSGCGAGHGRGRWRDAGPMSLWVSQWAGGG